MKFTFPLVLLTLCLFAGGIQCQTIDNVKRIQTGSKLHTVGINLNMALYPAGTAFNIANPNDATQVYNTLQSAVTNIGTSGGTVYIKQGLYVSARNVEVFNNKIHLKGDGIDKTIIKLKNNAVPFIFGSSTKSGFIRARGINNYIVSNMTLDGNKANQLSDEDHKYGRYGLFTEGCTDVWFDNVKIINFQGYGFDPHGWKSKNIYGKYLTLTNCIAENNDWDGFTLDQSYNITVHNCVAKTNGRHGFNVVTGSKYTNLTNNVAFNNGFYDPNGGSGCGIMIQNNQGFGTRYAVFNSNTLTRNKKAGFCINDVPNVQARNNTVLDSCYCLEVKKGKSSIFANNLCTVKTLTKVTETTVVNSGASTTGSAVYVFNNVFNKMATCPSSL